MNFLLMYMHKYDLDTAVIRAYLLSSHVLDSILVDLEINLRMDTTY